MIEKTIIHKTSPSRSGGWPVIIITGASGSVGKATVKAMAKEGWHVIMACRNIVKAENVKSDIIKEIPNASIEIKELEMSSQKSIRAFAASMEGRQIDALFNNAGIISRNYSVTEDGYEHTMAVNYVGPVLLTNLLLPYIKLGGNIVNMVSLTTKYAHIDTDWRNWGEEKFSQLRTYGSSKLALLYHTIALAKHHPELHINVSDPGIVDSNMISMGRWFDPLADIFFRPFIKTPEQGAAPAIRALHSKESLKYFVGKKTKDIDKKFLDSPLIDALYEI